jgi:sterol O-acyltransferase
VVEDYILPGMRQASMKGPWKFVSDMLVPVMLTQWLLFYLVFEVLCNAFAEVTLFADRQFYSE